MILILFEVILYFIEHMLFLKECSSSEHPESLVIWEKALHYLSITVLSLFVIEISLKIYAFGCKYLSRAINIFEVSVVFGGFMAEILLPNIGGDVASILIALRMIRLIRFAHAFQETLKEEKEIEISLLKKEIIKLKSQHLEFRRQVSTQDALTILEPENAILYSS